MKVALLTVDNREDSRNYTFPAPYFGAAPEALMQGFAAMPEIEVHVIGCTQHPMKSPEKIAANIFFHSLYVPKLGWMRTSYQGCVRAVRRCLKSFNPDIVHGQGTERECAVSAVFSKFPNVLTIHGNMAELARLFKAPMGSFGWLAAQLENIALKRTRGVFCNSEYTENLVRPRAPKTWRVPNAVREIFFDAPRNRPPEGTCVLLNIGIVSERKRQNELLEVARRLHERGVQCEIQFIGKISNDDYGARFRELLKEAEAKGYAHYLGVKSTAELIGCFDEAHGLVHFPSEEAFGLVVAEAMAREVKFFGSRTGGIIDISSGVPGVELYDPHDWDGLTEAIAKWIKQGHPRSGDSAKIMRERYHPQVIVQRHLEIYREVLSAKA